MKKTFIFLGIILAIFLITLFNCPTQQSSSGGSSSGGSNSTTYSAVGLYDPTFNNGGSGSDDIFQDIEIQSDGKILIGGRFTQYNGVDVPDGIIRLNEDGSIDSTFNNGGDGANNSIETIVVQSNGKIVIGGSFNTYNDVHMPDIPICILRLNTNGSHDSTFNNGGAGLHYMSDISDITIQSDSKILIGGGFNRYNDVDVPDCLIRLNTDGSHDSTFNTGGTGMDYSVDEIVYDIAIQSDGKILICGDFSQYNGVDVPAGIIRLY